MSILSVKVGNVELKNPVMPASGCFSHEYADAIDFHKLGAIVLKSVSPTIRLGNPLPRVAETNSGLLNSIGIPSKGIDEYLTVTLPKYRNYRTPLIPSFSADSIRDFSLVAKALTIDGVAALEANISCPNLEADGRAFSMFPDTTFKVVEAIRENTDLPLWVKLTPNAGIIAEVAQAAESAGADAIVMGNTVLGMSIDIHSRAPKLGNVMGGLSGPAIKPIALRMVYQCAQSVKIPIIGCGGISSMEDVIEFLLAGASAVQIGTASFRDPGVLTKIVDLLEKYCVANSITEISELIGSIQVDPNIKSNWQKYSD